MKRSPGPAKRSKSLTRIHAPFDRSMILLQVVVQIRTGSATAAATQMPFLLHRPVQPGGINERIESSVFPAGLAGGGPPGTRTNGQHDQRRSDRNRKSRQRDLASVLAQPDAKVAALCDIKPDRLGQGRQRGREAPAGDISGLPRPPRPQGCRRGGDRHALRPARRDGDYRQSRPASTSAAKNRRASIRPLSSAS